MSNLYTSELLARLERVDVPPDLLRNVLHEHAQAAARGSPETLAALIADRVAASGISGNQADVAMAANVRIRSLACLVRDHMLDDWIEWEYPDGIVLFHNSLFQAAAAEPLMLLANNSIGFDPASLRRRVLELAAVGGSA